MAIPKITGGFPRAMNRPRNDSFLALEKHSESKILFKENVMLIKNQQYEAVVTDYTAEGQGVAHVEGCAVFLPNAIAGEKYIIRIEKAAKNWAAGKIVEILEKSPHRVNRECPVA